MKTNNQPVPSRADSFKTLASGHAQFDVVVIGGGITGAGIAREAAGSGLKVLLVEQRDFAWGTSSRSSKMVHGGLRYLGSGHLALARDAVIERQRLMREAPGLIEPLRFIMPHYRKQFPGPRLFGLLLWVYDRLARQSSRAFLTPAQTQQWVPGLKSDQLVGASAFTDAVTDDARLVLRTLDEARMDGATCLNYVRADAIERQDGRVTGLTLIDEESTEAANSTYRVSSALIVNATGAWVDQLRGQHSGNDHIRPLRGSHLVVPFNALPVSCSVSLLHPEDGRPVFAFPWQGSTVLGTTDLDHQPGLEKEPAITEQEVDYLLKIAATLFPGHPLHRELITASWAGVRPVVSQGAGKTPSRENREHVIWDDQGLVSVAGGKLTTFRSIARAVLQRGLPYLDGHSLRPDDEPVFRGYDGPARPDPISHTQWRRLQGYYGPQLPSMLQAGPQQTIPDTDLLWAEVCWAVTHSDVQHLDDLMLRRTRLGLILPAGGRDLLSELKARCLPLMDWDEHRWHQEIERYQTIWAQAYYLPAAAEATA